MKRKVAILATTGLAFTAVAGTAWASPSDEVLPKPAPSATVAAPELASTTSNLDRTKTNPNVTVVSQKQLSASISTITQYTQCGTPDPSDTSGVMRFYVTYLRDTTPNPDKVRPIAFVLQNGFNHTVGVDIINHYPQAGTSNWYTNSSFVLTTPSSSGSQQAGNFWNSAGGQNDEQARGSLPARPYNVSDHTGNKWTVHRPQWNGDVTILGNDDPSRVSTYSPYNVPWWVPIRNDGPYFLAYYHVQGTYSTCAGWYPA